CHLLKLKTVTPVSPAQRVFLGQRDKRFADQNVARRAVSRVQTIDSLARDTCPGTTLRPLDELVQSNRDEPHTWLEYYSPLQDTDSRFHQARTRGIRALFHHASNPVS